MNISEQDIILNIFLNDILKRRFYSETGLSVRDTRITMFSLETVRERDNSSWVWSAKLLISIGSEALTLKHSIPYKYLRRQEGRHLYQLAENTVEQLLSKSR